MTTLASLCLGACVLVGTAALACGGDGSGVAGKAAAAVPADGPPATQGPSTAPKAAAARAGGEAAPVSPGAEARPAAAPPPDGKVGVAECDEYIEKYTECLMAKLPDKARPLMLDAMDQSARAWRDAAAGPAKDGVAATCRIAIEAAKQATASMGCSW